MRIHRGALVLALALPLSGCAISLGSGPQLRLGGDCSSLYYRDPMADPMERVSGRAAAFDAARRMQAMQMKQYATSSPSRANLFAKKTCQ